MASIMEKAHDLANAIKDSDELTNMRETEAAMARDNSAQEILQEYSQVRQKIDQKQASGEELTDDETAAVEEVQKKMQSHPVISAYLEAQREVNDILQGVNFLLTKALSGDQEDSCGPGCGGGCC